MESTLKELPNLFEDAKNNYEFEFVQTLINNHGIAENRTNTNFFEWFDAIDFYSTLYYQLNGKEKVRIGLLLYSTFYESSDIYRILGNLCYNKLGFRGSPTLYWKTKKLDRLLGTGEKVNNLIVLLEECNFKNIVDFFNNNHFQELRNTFFHSGYTIHDNHYFLLDSDPIIQNGVSCNSIDTLLFLFPKIENTITFFTKFKETYFLYFNSYTEDKNIQSYFPDLKKIIILGSEKGLAGFIVKNATNLFGQWVDALVKFDDTYNFWYTKNIEYTYPNQEDLITDERLGRYEKKEYIRVTDLEFQRLSDKIIERNRENEMKRLIVLLVKFGDNKYDSMQSETNLSKKKSFINVVLPFYKKAAALNKYFNLNYINDRILELERI